MYDKMFSDLIARSQNYMVPMAKANKLGVANLERLVAFQMTALHYYADTVISQMKAAADVSSPEDAQAFWNSQLETAAELRQKVLDDTKGLADLGIEFKDDFTKLAEENVDGLKATAAKAAKKAA